MPVKTDAAYACGSKDGEGRCATCPPGCRGRKAYERNLPSFVGIPADAVLCPECRDGKCRNCVGEALNGDDELVPCGCPNHKETTC